MYVLACSVAHNVPLVGLIFLPSSFQIEGMLELNFLIVLNFSPEHTINQMIKIRS